ncbi:hypothetical protein [Pararhizobium qamdonense]|uniref:hypothetical protein n=1 Tax=Pararhizobium qamdonense TaxID=3031126 RepID=UPI0023E2245A|nr:hypothetical protein [Pararhizobium qamdonense]
MAFKRFVIVSFIGGSSAFKPNFEAVAGKTCKRSLMIDSAYLKAQRTPASVVKRGNCWLYRMPGDRKSSLNQDCVAKIFQLIAPSLVTHSSM